MNILLCNTIIYHNSICLTWNQQNQYLTTSIKAIPFMQLFPLVLSIHDFTTSLDSRVQILVIATE